MPPSRQAADAALGQEESLLYGTLLMLNATSWEGTKFIDFSATMFRKQNAKAVEAILFHCYACIHGKASAKKAFKGLWPLIDKDRKQQKDYYQKVVDWLKELKDQGQLDVYTPTISSVLRAAAGPKLVALLLDLTTLALLREHGRAFPEDDLLLPGAGDKRLLGELALPLAAVSRAALQLEAQGFVELLGQGAALAAATEATAGQLQAEYYRLLAQQAQLQAAHEAAGLPPLLPPPAPASDVLRQALEMSASGTLGQTDTGSTSSSSNSSSSVLEAAVGGVQPLPSRQQAGQGDLLQQAGQLWQGLEGQLERYSDLVGLVEGVLGFEAHPHAIDGAQLAAAAGLEGDEGSGEVDVLALLQSWVGDLHQLSSSIHALAGTPPAPAHSSSRRVPGEPTPLLPSAVASSHAPHLAAQLGAHGGCLEGLRALRTQVASQLVNTEARVAQLEPRVYGAMAALELSQQEGPLIADLLADLSLVGAAAAGGDGSQAAAAAAAAGAGVAAPAMGPGAGRAPLQLVPPTPVLQQLLLKQQARQEQQEAGAAPAASGRLAEVQPLPLDLSPPVAAVTGSQGGVVPGPLVPPLVPPLPINTSSQALPAAESLDTGGDPQLGLELMSPELMDIDLVASDEDDFDQDVDLGVDSGSQGCGSPVAFPGWGAPAADAQEEGSSSSGRGHSKGGSKRVSLGLDLGPALAAASPSGSDDQLLGCSSSSGRGLADMSGSPDMSFAAPPEFAPGAFAAALAAAADVGSPAEGEDTPPRIGKGAATSKRRGGGGLALPRLSLQGWGTATQSAGAGAHMAVAAPSPLVATSGMEEDAAGAYLQVSGAAGTEAEAAAAAVMPGGDMVAAALALGSPVEQAAAAAAAGGLARSLQCEGEALGTEGAEQDLLQALGGSPGSADTGPPAAAAAAAGGGGGGSGDGGEAGDQVASLGPHSPTPGDQQLPDPFAAAHLSEVAEPFSELHPRRLTFGALPPDTQLPGWARARSRHPAAAAAAGGGGVATAAVAGGGDVPEAGAGAAASSTTAAAGGSGNSMIGLPAEGTGRGEGGGLGGAVGQEAAAAGGAGGGQLSGLRARFAQLKGG